MNNVLFCKALEPLSWSALAHSVGMGGLRKTGASGFGVSWGWKEHDSSWGSSQNNMDLQCANPPNRQNTDARADLNGDGKLGVCLIHWAPPVWAVGAYVWEMCCSSTQDFWWICSISLYWYLTLLLAVHVSSVVMSWHLVAALYPVLCPPARSQSSFHKHRVASRPCLVSLLLFARSLASASLHRGFLSRFSWIDDWDFSSCFWNRLHIQEKVSDFFLCALYDAQIRVLPRSRGVP